MYVQPSHQVKVLAAHVAANCQAWTKRRTQMQYRLKIQQAFILRFQATRQSDNKTGYKTWTWLNLQGERENKREKEKTKPHQQWDLNGSWGKSKINTDLSQS